MASAHSLANRFKSTLRHVEYDEQISDRDLNNLAGHPKGAALLEWLCENITSDNTLAGEELKRFNVLKERQQVLEGTSLREALSQVEHTSPGQDLTDDELRHSVASLSKQVLVLGGSNQRLQSQHAILSEQARQSGKRLEQIQRLEEKIKKDGTGQVQAVKQLNKQFNKQLEELMQTTGDVVAATTAQSDSPRSGSNTGFLSSQSLTGFQSCEEDFMRSLTEHTKKRFQGVRDLASDSQQCHLLDTRDPQQLLLEGESQAAIAEACTELVRLRSIFVAGQLQLHRVEAATAKVTAAVAFLEKKLSVLKAEQAGGLGATPPSGGSDALRLQQEEAEKGVKKLKDEIRSIVDTKMPAILTDLSALQDTHVLSGNYRLKLARQRYFLDKQTELIDHLLQQRARHEVLGMMLELEERQHRRSDQLVQSLQSELSVCCQQLTTTKDVSKNPCLKRPDPGRHAVDSRDSTMTLLSTLLSSSNLAGESTAAKADNQLIITYEHIQQQADKLSQLTASQASQLSARDDAFASQLSSLEECIGACDQVVAGHGVEEGLPTMELQDLRKRMADLEDLLGMLQRSVKDSLRQWSEKVKILSADEVEQEGRKIFAWFFTDPLKVELCIQHLQRQVEQ